MSVFIIEQIKEEVSKAADAYDAFASDDEQISRVSPFGSYANGCATQASDIDLLIRFTSAIVSLFTLAKALDHMEKKLGVSVDIVQDSILEGSLLSIQNVIPLYERI